MKKPKLIQFMKKYLKNRAKEAREHKKNPAHLNGEFTYPFIIDKKDYPSYRKSSKNHSFWNGEDSPKICFPISKYDLLERFGYWIVDTRKSVTYMKSLSPEEFPEHIKKLASQGARCKDGACTL